MPSKVTITHNLTEEKQLAEFSHPKNPNIEHIKPKNSFDHPCQLKSGVPLGDNAMTKFIVSNRTDAIQTDVNFLITSCQLLH